MRLDKERLQDIIDAIHKIQRYAEKGRNIFDKDELIQTWIIHNILLIGEAATRISEDLKNENKEIPWSQITGVRNILVHNYFGIDLEEIWSTVTRDLPDLKRNITTILQIMEEDEKEE